VPDIQRETERSVAGRTRPRSLFGGFNEASRLLSPFPTMTNVALSTMLGATAPLGYESLYFNRDEHRLCGGARKYIGWRTPDKVPSSYMDELDYQEPLPFEFLVYVAPETIWRADMRRFRERFRAAPPDRDFFAFLKGTDGLLHIRGARRLDVALESLDRILRDIQEHCGAETEIVLFSDHGMNLQDNRRINLATHLRAAGYEVADDLGAASHSGGSVNRQRSVAVPAFGLCGYAAVYCAEETDAAQVADALTSLEGVDFSIRREGASAIVLKGAHGAARIHRAQRNLAHASAGEESDADGSSFSYRYEQLAGDPLQLSQTLADLQRDGRLDEHGFASDTDWLTRTAEHVYPDPLANLFDSLHSPRVQHTADLLLSLHDGYYYGATLFSRLVRLRATHGNALRSSTTAFLMSTHRNLPPFIRANEARPVLRD
jgi:hypothetical protein